MLSLFRLPNLLIVVLTQYLIQYGVLRPAFAAADLAPDLDHFQFALLVFSTVLIAASGYVINDLVDLEIDKINKPQKVVIDQQISVLQAQYLYYGLIVLGFLVLFYLPFIFTQNLILLLIYVVAVALLWAYSYYFKKQALFGNLIVSLFCAFVPGIVLFTERLVFFELQLAAPALAQEVLLIVGGYACFAFISTLFREIIKDIEDIEGDLAYGCKTLPIVWGVPKTKWIVTFVGIIFLFLLLQMGVLFRQHEQYLVLGFCLLFLTTPLLALLFKLQKANTSQAFHQLSTGAKILMLNGLLLLIGILGAQASCL